MACWISMRMSQLGHKTFNTTLLSSICTGSSGAACWSTSPPLKNVFKTLLLLLVKIHPFQELAIAVYSATRIRKRKNDSVLHASALYNVGLGPRAGAMPVATPFP
jgi:hypothetical protein